ncbi:glycine rich domain-containing protein [Segatella albensis]|uniref:glycine rich domain-containing protein n=1 Tax=Segatella albensis TaxID=77768 RepID=UPI0004693CB3|nr:glycine rich domain-containing protein [Segatella albensis]
MQTFIAPINTTYKIECWGASGGYFNEKVSGKYYDNKVSGKGGYSIGYKNLSTSNKLYVCVGQCPGDILYLDYSYNGGGGGDASGGGASHIAISNRGELYNYLGYENEVF